MDDSMRDYDTVFLNHVAAEVDRAREKFPTNKHKLAAMMEEAGEVVKAMLDHEYEKDVSEQDIYKECVQAAAMCLRVAIDADPEYRYHGPTGRDPKRHENPN